MVRRFQKRSRYNSDNEFDEVFPVPGREIFYFGDQEIEVENAYHAIKDGQEYIILNDQLYPIDRIDNRAVTNKNSSHSSPHNKGSSVKIAAICLILGIVVGLIAYFVVLPILTHNASEEQYPVEYYPKNYQWTYGGHSYSYSIAIPKPLYEYYRQQSHDRKIAQYAISLEDRRVLDRIITSFREGSHSESEAAHNVIAFVQSLPYTLDYVSTGFDEYPRYPIETLVDGQGDCEDTAILTAALLKEMGYDVVLISPPDHMAVGITCEDCSGPTVTYDNKEYYYLETTSENWRVGKLPSQFRNDKVKIYPIRSRSANPLTSFVETIVRH